MKAANFQFFSRLFSPKFIESLDVTPQRTEANRTGIAVCAIVLNECRYIAEWIRFHEFAGVSHFYLYDDGSTDSTIEAAMAALKTSEVTILPWRQKIQSLADGISIRNQVLAYAHCVANYGNRQRWLAFIDVDEFIVPLVDVGLAEAMARYGDLPQISLPWAMYGRNGVAVPPKDGLLKNFTRRSNRKSAINVKTIADPMRLTQIHVHRSKTDNSNVTWNDKGEKIVRGRRNEADVYTNCYLQLNHYFTRSDQDLREKLEKRRVRTSSMGYPFDEEKLKRRVEEIEKETVVDLCALDFIERREGALGVKL